MQGAGMAAVKQGFAVATTDLGRVPFRGVAPQPGEG
jgi:hypothetical protein